MEAKAASDSGLAVVGATHGLTTVSFPPFGSRNNNGEEEAVTASIRPWDPQLMPVNPSSSISTDPPALPCLSAGTGEVSPRLGGTRVDFRELLISVTSQLVSFPKSTPGRSSHSPFGVCHHQLRTV